MGNEDKGGQKREGGGARQKGRGRGKAEEGCGGDKRAGEAKRVKGSNKRRLGRNAAAPSSHLAPHSPRTHPGCPGAWFWPRPLRETSWGRPHPTHTGGKPPKGREGKRKKKVTPSTVVLQLLRVRGRSSKNCTSTFSCSSSSFELFLRSEHFYTSRDALYYFTRRTYTLHVLFCWFPLLHLSHTPSFTFITTLPLLLLLFYYYYYYTITRYTLI